MSGPPQTNNRSALSAHVLLGMPSEAPTKQMGLFQQPAA